MLSVYPSSREFLGLAFHGLEVLNLSGIPVVKAAIDHAEKAGFLIGINLALLNSRKALKVAPSHKRQTARKRRTQSYWPKSQDHWDTVAGPLSRCSTSEGRWICRLARPTEDRDVLVRLFHPLFVNSYGHPVFSVLLSRSGFSCGPSPAGLERFG
jgi:hypothetical protein